MARLEYYPKGFASRSWKMVRRDPGWYKPILVMAVSLLVPIIGAMGVAGYSYEWARVTAWGQESAPRQKGVKIGALIKSGFRVTIVTLAWVLIFGAVRALFVSLNLGTIGSLIELALFVFGLFWTVLVQIAALIATIYQKASAGFAVKKIWSMLKRDTGGFFKMWFSCTLFSLIIVVLVSIICYAIMLPIIGMVIGSLGYIISYGDPETSLYLISQLLRDLTVPLALIIIVSSIFAAVSSIVSINAVALWVMQFNVPNWGEASEEVPSQTIPASVMAEPTPVDPFGLPGAAPTPAAPEVPATPAAPEETPTAEAPAAEAEAPVTEDAPSETPAEDSPEGSSSEE